jgi:hypothetical protein
MVESLPKDRIDTIPVLQPEPEHIVSEALKKPIQPHPVEDDE